jgi:hypothetical protein
MTAAVAEKRKYQPRLEAYMKARIIVPSKVSDASCVIRQISPAGAQLEIAPEWILPRSFWLRIVGESQMHYYTLLWREGVLLSVEFRSGQRSAWRSRSRELSQVPNRARV